MHNILKTQRWDQRLAPSNTSNKQQPFTAQGGTQKSEHSQTTSGNTNEPLISTYELEKKKGHFSHPRHTASMYMKMMPTRAG